MRAALLWLFLIGRLGIFAQPPAIGQNGILNSASRIPSALTGASIARRSRFTIEGVRLGTAPSGVRVLLEHGERSILLPVISVDSTRMEAWMPAAAPPGPGKLRVETSAGTSKPFPVAVVRSQIGLFSANQKGWGPGRIDNIGSNGKRVANGVESPTRLGQMVEVSGTGLGEARDVGITIGGQAVPATGSRSREGRGTDAIRFRIPANAPKGCYVPVYARASGYPRSNIVTLSIADDGVGCETPEGWPGPREREKRLGVVGISRTLAFFGSGQPAITYDHAFGTFSQNQPSFHSNRLLLVPPAGSCTAYTGLYNVDMNEFESVAAALVNPGQARRLDGGTQFTISGSGRALSVPRSDGVYWTRLGFDDPSIRRSQPLFLNDPVYRFSTTGGNEIAAFSGILPALPTPQWTNRDALATIQRSRGASIEWSGVSRDSIVLIMAASFDPLSTAGGICYCAARGDSGRMVIPAEMFAHFPDSGNIPGPWRSGVALIALRLQSGTPPTNLDLLRLISVFASVRRADYY
jgi:uncharacterized protein (TIGR03437 family)